jgi:hypothetical protein
VHGHGGEPPAARRRPAGAVAVGFVACGAVVRRVAFGQVGGFDPLVPFGGEETLVAFALAAAGWAACLRR